MRKIGILGGGQLGRMLYQSSINLPVEFHFLDHSNAPIKDICPNFSKGTITKHDEVVQFGLNKDVISIEIENISTEGLKDLESRGIACFPQAEIIEIFKDKGKQKAFYKAHNLPTAPYQVYKDSTDYLEASETSRLGLPHVQKSRVGGYDGKGVEIMYSLKDIKDKGFQQGLIVEEKADIEKELGLIIARNNEGQTAIYDPVEMVFNEANLVDYVLAPAQIDDKISQQVKEIAESLVNKLDFIGVLAVEFFLNNDGSIWINECAPRTHNSGHWSIEGAVCSQFEQHTRILANYPLGSTKMNCSYALMFNLIGDQECNGKVFYHGLNEALAEENCFVHLYGKKETRPNRKMGHVTLIGNDKNVLLTKAKSLKSQIKVLARNES